MIGNSTTTPIMNVTRSVTYQSSIGTNCSTDHCSASEESNTPPHYYHLPLTAIVVILICILLIGFVGNILVVIIVVKKRRMQTCTNWLIANLAVCDLAVSVFCIPLDIPIIVTEKWMYGEFFCVLYYPTGTAIMYGSILTLVALTYTRFWAIRYPFREQAGAFVAKIVIAGIWILSFVLVAPLVSVLRYNSKYQVCYEDWGVKNRAAYTLCMFLLGYAVPLLVITVAYGFILYEIIFRKRPYVKQSDTLVKENRKLFKLALVITVTFVVCVSPNQLIWLLFEFGDFDKHEYITDIRVCSHLLLFLNSALNPIIYNVFSASFRDGFKQFKQGFFSKARGVRRTPTLVSELNLNMKSSYTLKPLMENGRVSRDHGEREEGV